MTVNITQGTGSASVAAELVGTLQYQRIEVMGQGGASVLGVNPDGSLNASIVGVPRVSTGNASIIAVIQGSVAAVLIGTVNQSVSGTVGASIIGQLPAGTAPIGSVAALQGTNPWNVTGSVVALSQGSIIAVVQSSSILAVPVSSTIAVLQSSSILAVPVGSVITVLQAPSIVGTYAEDAASASGDKGLLVMGARNDLLSSVTSADGDYSSHVVGPAGELIAANAPFTKWVQGTADFRQGNAGASIIVIPAGGTSVFTYVTGVQVANMGSASVLVTLASGGSVLGYTIAPAGGGSNMTLPNAHKTPGGFGYAASLSGIASVLVSAQGFVAKV